MYMYWVRLYMNMDCSGDMEEGGVHSEQWENVKLEMRAYIGRVSCSERSS